MSKSLILIPSRLSASRLPGKPLLKINGTSIISHVVNKAKEADVGEVYVATEDKDILDDVSMNGGKAILTSNQHKTGSDRIFECYEKLNLKNIDYLINLQGDEPDIDINDLRHLVKLLKSRKPEIGTLASEMKDQSKLNNENIVKVITENKITDKNFPFVFDFKRRVKDSKLNIYHHLGIYCYQNETLKNLVSLNQSFNEVQHNLEQLRAMDNGIKINVALAKSSPIGVDTREDFVAIKKIMEYKS